MAHKFKPTTTTTKGNIDLMRKSSNSKLKKTIHFYQPNPCDKTSFYIQGYYFWICVKKNFILNRKFKIRVLDDCCYCRNRKILNKKIYNERSNLRRQKSRQQFDNPIVIKRYK